MAYLVYNSSKFVCSDYIKNYILPYYSYLHHYKHPLLFNSSLFYIHSEVVSVNQLKYKERSLNEWLAGVIDGDGYFNTGKSPRFSIEMDRKNLPLMTLIQKITQGRLVLNIKNRPNVIRVDVAKRDLLISLLHRVNGNIRNSIRVAQYTELCTRFNIPFIAPVPLTFHNAWFTGFFDADGGVRATFTSRSPSITIYVTNKYSVNLVDYQTIFGGYIRPHDNKNSYRWTIDHSDSVLNMLSYFECYPSMSHKYNRIILINRFYALKKIKAFKVASTHHQEWLDIKSRWMTS